MLNYFSNKTGFFQEVKIRHYCKKQRTEAFKSPATPPWKSMHNNQLKMEVQKALYVY